MYKLGSVPGISANISELADFLEIKCLFSDERLYSISSARSALSIEADEYRNEGIESEDDLILRRLEDTLQEIEERIRRSNNRYPFTTKRNQIRLNGLDSAFDYVYLYLLLATRINMGTERMVGEVDGTLLFEELSSYVAKSYFGKNSKSIVFGTSARETGTFKDKILFLLSSLNEGGGFKEPIGSTGKQNDGKLDIVVWKPFRDNRGSKLIGLGQCKTGTSWNGALGQLQPSAFFGSYTTCCPYHDPVRLFFIAESCTERWEETARIAGILFDRCRFMDYLPENLPEELLTKVKTWVDSMITKYIN